MDVLETLDIRSWDEKISQQMKDKAIKSLEEGKVLFLPKLAFQLTEKEKPFLSTKYVDPKAKNISFMMRQDKLNGTICNNQEAAQLKAMIKRYAISSEHLLSQLLPHYTSSLIQARTSYRPVEIEGRVSSYRKDDSRLHVDSFPSNPVKGERILRVFTNINPDGRDRVWRLGEPFADVVEKMAPQVRRPIPGLAYLLKLLNITKDYRSLYDHYMLSMHDSMKGDMNYQHTVRQKEVKFPPGSTWIVFTDKTSHAAMEGQYVLEQTYQLPVKGMMDESLAPLRILENYTGKALV